MSVTQALFRGSSSVLDEVLDFNDQQAGFVRMVAVSEVGGGWIHGFGHTYGGGGSAEWE